MSDRETRVYCVIIIPGVKKHITGNNQVIFEKVNEFDEFFPDTALAIHKIASIISPKNIKILDAATSYRSNIIGVLNYFLNGIPHNDLKKTHPIAKGDFVFIFLFTHGKVIFSKGRERYEFRSNSDPQYNLKIGYTEKAFIPYTSAPLLPSSGDPRKKIEWSKKITKETFNHSYLENAKSKTYPYIIDGIPTSGSFTLPVYDFIPYKTPLTVDHLESRDIKYDIKTAHIYESPTNKKEINYFYRYIRQEKSGSKTVEYYIVKKTSKNEFCYLPPSSAHTYLEFAYTLDKNPQKKWLNLSSDDLNSIFPNTMTNVFFAIEACYSGLVLRGSKHSEIPYTIWTSSHMSTPSWAASKSPNNNGYCSYFIDGFESSIRKTSDKTKQKGYCRYANCMNFINYYVQKMAASKKKTQTPCFLLNGETEFYGKRSRHPKFPFHGDLQ